MILKKLEILPCCHGKYDYFEDILAHLRQFHGIGIDDLVSGTSLQEGLQELFNLGIIHIGLALHMPTKVIRPTFIVGSPSP